MAPHTVWPLAPCSLTVCRLDSPRLAIPTSRLLPDPVNAVGLTLKRTTEFLSSHPPLYLLRFRQLAACAAFSGWQNRCTASLVGLVGAVCCRSPDLPLFVPGVQRAEDCRTNVGRFSFFPDFRFSHRGLGEQEQEQEQGFLNSSCISPLCTLFSLSPLPCRQHLYLWRIPQGMRQNLMCIPRKDTRRRLASRGTSRWLNKSHS